MSRVVAGGTIVRLGDFSVSLFDVLGYLVPGIVALAALWLLGAVIGGAVTLDFGVIGAYWLVLVVASYYLGYFCHAVSGMLIGALPRAFKSKADDAKLSEGLYRRVRDVAEEVYGVTIDSDKGAHRRELYAMADSFVVTSGMSAERDSLIAREGFAKTSMAAFGALSVALLVDLLAGSPVALVFADSGEIHPSALWTLIVLVVALCGTLVFRSRYMFFHRLKINNTEIMFAALADGPLSSRGQGSVG